METEQKKETTSVGPEFEAFKDNSHSKRIKLVYDPGRSHRVVYEMGLILLKSPVYAVNNVYVLMTVASLLLPLYL